MQEFDTIIENYAVRGASLLGPLPEEEGTTTHIHVRNLAQSLLLNPSIRQVFCWLFCTAYDVIDIARILSVTDFRGDLVACASQIPNPRMIQKEVAMVAPSVSLILHVSPALCRANETYERSLKHARSNPAQDVAV